MGKIAFVFAGQGAQYSGMGDSLMGSPAARLVFSRVEALRSGTVRQCFFGTAEELSETRNTQPCMLAVELAAADVMNELGIKADMTAGFSLGEIAALCYAGAFSYEDGFRLVCRRAELMDAAGHERPGEMAAVLKLADEEVERLCGIHGVWPVNYNCPGQVSVAGVKEKMPGFIAAVKEAGGRAMPLKVSGAFHSPLMEVASAAFRAELMYFPMEAPKIPVYSDLTAEPYTGADRETLAAQIKKPVRWTRIIENMLSAGCDTFIELGPGKTLSGLIGRITKDARVFQADSLEAAQKIAEEL